MDYKLKLELFFCSPLNCVSLMQVVLAASVVTKPGKGEDPMLEIRNLLFFKDYKLL